MKKILMLLLATVLMNVGYVFGQIDTIVLNEVSYTLFSRGFYVNVDLFPYPTGYDHCGDRTKVVPVTNPITGDTWMDRNLGASQAATASDDENSFGDLFQWGRFADGHQCRSSGLHYPDSLAITAVPNAGNAWDGLFITTYSDIADWLSPQDDNLWQGVKWGEQPVSKRLPTSY